MNLRRRLVITLIGGAVAGWPLAAHAQQLARTPTVSLLTTSAAARSRENLAELVEGLRALGYVEGRNVKITAHFTEGRSDTLAAFAAQLVRDNVNVIVAAPTQAIRAAQQATRTIPIVMANTSDPVRLGFIQSLAHPGGNITGLSNQAADIGPKQLQLLKEIAPKARRVAVLINPRNPSHERWRDYREPAARLGMSLATLEAATEATLGGVFAALERDLPDAILVLGDAVFLNERVRIAEWERAARRPAIYVFREHVEAGGLMSYGPSARANYRRAAAYVDKILKGSKPADLPVEQPTKFDLVINLKTARALGLTVPATLLAAAEEVIE